MLNAFKARLCASTALLVTAKQQREIIGDVVRAIYKLVLPGTIGAGYVDCACLGPRQLVDNCPYHGREARRLARG